MPVQPPTVGGRCDHSAGSTNNFPQVLQQVAKCRVAGDTVSAETLINTIATASVEAIKRPGRPSIGATAAVFARDRYQCRFCGRKVLLQNVMRLLAALYPAQFPWNPTRQITCSHSAFTSCAATVDHLNPTGRGGTKVQLEDLVTAYWLRNNRKATLTLNEAIWELEETTDLYWQGLSDLYERFGEPAAAHR